MSAIIASAIRHVLTAVGLNQVLNGDEINQLVGAIAGLIGVLWALGPKILDAWRKRARFGAAVVLAIVLAGSAAAGCGARSRPVDLDLGLPRVNGEAAAALGYVNPGDDYRLGGELGARLGRIQRELSFRDPRPPAREVRTLEDGSLLEVATAPTGQVHYSLAVPRSNGRWDTFRYGYRFDPNWGDANSVGVDPRPDLPPGGYIYDVVIKLNQERPHIEGH